MSDDLAFQRLQRRALARVALERRNPVATLDFVLDATSREALQHHLHALGWLESERIVSAERIGDGNMNMTVRIRTDRSSFVLKQARPWVVKYPQIPAPIERASVEATFYGVVSAIPEIAAHMPQLLGFDPEAHLLWLEDLGETADLMSLYGRGKLSGPECIALTEYLVKLHRVTVPGWADATLRNRAMRQLNHEHQYDVPLRADNGIDLDKITPGLAAAAAELRADAGYRARIAALGTLYLADGPVLVQGDFFPGSWLVTGRGVVVIDPEFCHLGRCEYDLGVFLAHLELIHSRELWDTVVQRYSGDVNWPLARRFAGAEIMRRLIGVAQLPVAADLASKRVWLEFSRSLVCAL